jgi:drug/metabolite transporter (DMT)-like permease
VAQATAVLFFKERLAAPVLAGGALIVGGGVLMTFWRT